MLCHVHPYRIPFWRIMMPLFLDHYAEYVGTTILETLVTVDLLTGCDNEEYLNLHILFVQPYALSVLPFLTISTWTKYEWMFLSVVKNIHLMCALQCTLLPPVYELTTFILTDERYQSLHNHIKFLTPATWQLTGFTFDLIRSWNFIILVSTSVH
jgi:hypothetical protein